MNLLSAVETCHSRAGVDRIVTWVGSNPSQFKQLVEKPGVSGSVKRSVVRSLQFILAPKSLQGEVANLCFGYLADPSEEPAIRIFSMSVLQNLVVEVPDLGSELKLIIEDQLPYATPGFRSRANKVLKHLNRTIDRKP